MAIRTGNRLRLSTLSAVLVCVLVLGGSPARAASCGVKLGSIFTLYKGTATTLRAAWDRVKDGPVVMWLIDNDKMSYRNYSGSWTAASPFRMEHSRSQIPSRATAPRYKGDAVAAWPGHQDRGRPEQACSSPWRWQRSSGGNGERASRCPGEDHFLGDVSLLSLPSSEGARGRCRPRQGMARAMSRCPAPTRRGAIWMVQVLPPWMVSRRLPETSNPTWRGKNLYVGVHQKPPGKGVGHMTEVCIAAGP